MTQQFVLNKKNIHGWGVDADKSVRPNYPMWKKPPEGTGAHWDVPEQQPNFNDFHSIERAGPTHVFGTAPGPSGISGKIRKIAYKFSESEWEHWIILLFADRVNVFEGLFDDVVHGKMPRLLEERGWSVDKKFKTKRYKKVRALQAVAAIAPLAYFLLRSKNKTSSPIQG